MAADNQTLHMKGRTRIVCKHEPITAELERRIRTGAILGKLPGMNALAAEFSVNPLTIRKVLDALDRKGLIERKRRVGIFVRHKKRIGVFILRHSAPLPPSRSREELLPSALQNIVCGGIASVINAHRFSIQTQVVSYEDWDYINYLKNEVDGAVVIASSRETARALSYFREFPFVRAMGKVEEDQVYHHITYDNTRVGAVAVDYLRTRGCRCLLYVGDTESTLSQERFAGFVRAADGLEWRLMDGGLRQDSLPDFLHRLETNLPPLLHETTSRRPGLFLAGDEYAIPVYQLLRGMGIMPMRDIPIISCDNNHYLRAGLYLPPAAVDIHAFDIGRRATELLLDMLDRKKLPSTRKIILPPTLSC